MKFGFGLRMILVTLSTANFLWSMSLGSMAGFTRMDSLFIIAATGEPRFQSIRDSAQIILVKDSGTENYLLTHRLIGQTPRQRHYVETLFSAIADSGKNHGPVKKIGKALLHSPDSLRIQLLQIGSELKDSSFLSVAKLYLISDSEEVRKSAIRSFGMYPNPTQIQLLIENCLKSKGLERQENLWALSKQRPRIDLNLAKQLVPILQDPFLYNRQLVRRIIQSNEK